MSYRNTQNSFLKKHHDHRYAVPPTKAGAARSTAPYLQDSSEFLVFLSSNAILDDPWTLPTLASYDSSFLTAKLVTNTDRGLIKNTCEFGWNRTDISDQKFMTEPEVEPRFKVSKFTT